MRRRKRRVFLIFLQGMGAFLLLLTIVFGINHIYDYRDMLHMVQTFTYDEEKLRKFDVSPKVLTYYLDKCKSGKVDPVEEMTIMMMAHNYRVTSTDEVMDKKMENRCRTKFKKKKEYPLLYGFYKTMLSDLRYFPVPSDLHGNQTVGFDDSWLGKRTFGGERFHEGCDLMTSNNERGYFPIVSISDGVVENKGWLKLGGYRIGIRSKNGCYYYYAHLFSYADGLNVGDTVSAGELLGFMGDTGYSEIEGTKGNFDVHLHMGMYVTLDGKETSVNPYAILRYLEQHKLAYYF